MEKSLIAFAGDWHGSTFWARTVIRVLHRFGVRRIYHVGDFGIWPNEMSSGYISGVHKKLEEFDMELWVTPGNHEWWDKLDELFAFNSGSIAKHSKKFSRIKYLPRGFRWEDQGVSFVSLGGAPSIDRDYRRRGGSWWPQEVITDEDVDLVVSGGYADIMITHDSPNPGTRAVQNIVAGPSTWPPLARIYADNGREVLTRAFEGVKPKLLVHGHYHIFDILRADEWGNIISLTNEHATQGGNVVLIDPEEFQTSDSFEIQVPKIIPVWT